MHWNHLQALPIKKGINYDNHSGVMRVKYRKKLNFITCSVENLTIFALRMSTNYKKEASLHEKILFKNNTCLKISPCLNLVYNLFT